MAYRPIEWKPIQAPDFSSANQMMVAAGDTFNQALKNLTGVAETQQDIAQKNYDKNQDVLMAEQFRNLGPLEQAALEQRIQQGFGDTGLSGANQLKLLEWSTNRHNTLADTAADQKFQLDQFDKETQRQIAQEKTRQGFEAWKLQENHLNGIDDWLTQQYATYMSGDTGLVDEDGNPVKRTQAEGEEYLNNLRAIIGNREITAPPPILKDGVLAPSSTQPETTPHIVSFGSERAPAPKALTVNEATLQHKGLGNILVQEAERINADNLSQAELALTGGVAPKVVPTSEPVPTPEEVTATLFGSLPKIDSTKSTVAPVNTAQREIALRGQSRTTNQGLGINTGTGTGDVAVAPNQFESTGSVAVDNLFTATGLVPQSKQNMTADNRTKTDERLAKANDASVIYDKQIGDLQAILARPEGIKGVTGTLGRLASNSKPEWYEQPLVAGLQLSEELADATTKLFGDDTTDERIDQKAVERGEVRGYMSEFEGGSFVALGKEVGTTDVSNADAKDYKVSVADLDAASATEQGLHNALTKSLILLEYRKRKGLAEANLKPNQHLTDDQKNVLMRQVESDLGLVKDGNNWRIRPMNQGEDINTANQVQIQKILTDNPNTASPNSPSEAQLMYDRDSEMLLSNPTPEMIKHFISTYGESNLPPELR